MKINRLSFKAQKIEDLSSAFSWWTDLDDENKHYIAFTMPDGKIFFTHDIPDFRISEFKNGTIGFYKTLMSYFYHGAVYNPNPTGNELYIRKNVSVMEYYPSIKEFLKFVGENFHRNENRDANDFYYKIIE